MRTAMNYDLLTRIILMMMMIVDMHNYKGTPTWVDLKQTESTQL